MRYDRGERVLLWLADHSPRLLLEQPERVLINVACILIGISALLPGLPDGSVMRAWPEIGRWVWASVMLIGASFSLYGTATLNRSADRIGALFLASASSFLAVLLFGQTSGRAYITATIFFGIAIDKLFRFLRSTAVRIRTRRHLIEEKERQREGRLS